MHAACHDLQNPNQAISGACAEHGESLPGKKLHPLAFSSIRTHKYLSAAADIKTGGAHPQKRIGEHTARWMPRES